MQNGGNIMMIIVVWYSRIPVQSRSPDVWKEALWVWETIKRHKHTRWPRCNPWDENAYTQQKSKHY